MGLVEASLDFIIRRSADEQKRIDLWEDMVYNWKNWMERRRAKVSVVGGGVTVGLMRF